MWLRESDARRSYRVNKESGLCERATTFEIDRMPLATGDEDTDFLIAAPNSDDEVTNLMDAEAVSS